MSPLNPLEPLPDLTLLATLVGRDRAQHLLAQSKGSLDHVLREACRSYDPRGQRPPSPLGAAFELVKRATLEAARHRNALTSPQLVREFVTLQLAHLEFEVFLCLMLDAQHHLIEAAELFRGTHNQTSVYPREVVKQALAANAAAVILVHNHPSGSPDPSQADLHLTGVLKSALALVDVSVLDHLIVGGNCALSLAERGLM